MLLPAVLRQSHRDSSDHPVSGRRQGLDLVLRKLAERRPMSGDFILVLGIIDQVVRSVVGPSRCRKTPRRLGSRIAEAAWPKRDPFPPGRPFLDRSASPARPLGIYVPPAAQGLKDVVETLGLNSPHRMPTAARALVVLLEHMIQLRLNLYPSKPDRNERPSRAFADARCPRHQAASAASPKRENHVIRIMRSRLDLARPADHPGRARAVVIRARLGEGKGHAVVGKEHDNRLVRPPRFVQGSQGFSQAIIGPADGHVVAVASSFRTFGVSGR